MSKVLPLPLVAGATIVAVAFWSLKPIFISMIGDRTGYAEVFLIAGAISTTVSVIASLFMARTTRRLLTSPDFGSGLIQAMISGAFLAVWYYCFYRALFGSQKVDATIIAFSWPLIAVVAMRIFAPEHARKLSLSEWALIATAYLGAIAIGISGISRSGFLAGFELLFAFAAAIGSGFYLPFAINAISRFNTILNNRIAATFYAISFANLTSLILVSLIIWATDQTLLFYAVDIWVVLICALIGVGTYLLAEITWTWAFSEYKSLTLSSLAYLSPAFSVVLLFILFDEAIASISAFGLVLILFSNMTLHGSYKSSNALVSALIGTLYVALISLFIAPSDVPQLTDMLYFISGLFAILAGFILSRVSSRRAQEIDQRSTAVRMIVDHVTLDKSQDVEHADAVLRGIIDIEFDASLAKKDARSEKVRAHIHKSGLSDSIRHAQLLAFDTWLNIHRDRLSVAEKTALWLTGSVSIMLLLVVRGSDPLATVGLYAFAAGCLLVIFSISDYESNNFQGFRRQILRLQDGFREIGRPYYLPKSLVDNNEIPRLFDNSLVRYCDENGTICQYTIVPARNTFRIVYLGTATLLVGALLTLPIFMAGETRDRTVLSLRPELFADVGWNFGGDLKVDLTVGVLDWGASRVIAEIVKQTLEQQLSLNVSLQETTVDAVLQSMAAEEGAIDIHSDFWVGNQPNNFRQFVERDQSVRLNNEPYPGRQGIYLPSEDAEHFGLVNLSQLAQPEVAAIFDTDGDGLGEIWIGAPTWQSTRAMEQLLTSYGLSDLWSFEEYADTIFKAKLRQFRAQGRPIVFYGFEPDWVHAAFDLRALSISPVGESCPDILGIEQDGNACTFRSVPVHLGYATRLEMSHPEAARYIQAIRFTTEDVNVWLAALAAADRDPADVATAWIEANSEIVATWRSAALN